MELFWPYYIRIIMIRLKFCKDKMIKLGLTTEEFQTISFCWHVYNTINCYSARDNKLTKLWTDSCFTICCLKWLSVGYILPIIFYILVIPSILSVLVYNNWTDWKKSLLENEFLSLQIVITNSKYGMRKIKFLSVLCCI